MVAIVLSLTRESTAQTKEISVAYLRAAIGSLPDRAAVQLTALFLPEQGLLEASGSHLRGKGYCRFSVRDPRSGVIFASMYCRQDSPVFKELVASSGPQNYRFSGYKDYGEQNEPSIHVTSAEALAEKPVRIPGEKGAKTFRVILRDQAGSNQTELANVILGKTYNAAGITFTVEEETVPRLEGIGTLGP
jgi:hypothetical protein